MTSQTTIKTKIAKIDEQITKLTADKAELEATLAAFIDTNTLVPGVAVAFLYGRGPGRQELIGAITGRKEGDADKAAQIRVAVGEGFDATLYTISVDQVTRIVVAAA